MFKPNKTIQKLEIYQANAGGALGPSPSPWGTPTSARPGTGFGQFFIEEKLSGISKRVPLKFKMCVV